MRALLVIALGSGLSGCAQLVFNPAPQDDALSYFEPVPHLYVVTNKDCTRTATLLMLPGQKKSVSLRSGYGSADLSVNLSNGMISSVGQKTDTKIPETITALTGVAKAAAGFAGPTFVPQGVAGAPTPKECQVNGSLYHVNEAGEPDYKVDFPPKGR